MPYTGDVDGVCGKGKTPSVRRRIFSKQRYEKFSSCRQSPAIFSSLGRGVQVLKKRYFAVVGKVSSSVADRGIEPLF